MYLFAYISFIPLFEKKEKKNHSKKNFKKLAFILQIKKKRKKKSYVIQKNHWKKNPLCFPFLFIFHWNIIFWWTIETFVLWFIVYFLLGILIFGTWLLDWLAGIGVFLEHISGLFFIVRSWLFDFWTYWLTSESDFLVKPETQNVFL